MSSRPAFLGRIIMMKLVEEVHEALKNYDGKLSFCTWQNMVYYDDDCDALLHVNPACYFNADKTIRVDLCAYASGCLAIVVGTFSEDYRQCVKSRSEFTAAGLKEAIRAYIVWITKLGVETQEDDLNLQKRNKEHRERHQKEMSSLQLPPACQRSGPGSIPIQLGEWVQTTLVDAFYNQKFCCMATPGTLAINWPEHLVAHKQKHRILYRDETENCVISQHKDSGLYVSAELNDVLGCCASSRMIYSKDLTELIRWIPGAIRKE